MRQTAESPETPRKTFYEVKATTFHEVKATTFYEVKASMPHIGITE